MTKVKDILFRTLLYTGLVWVMLALVFDVVMLVHHLYTNGI